jgi:hypothetical protein
VATYFGFLGRLCMRGGSLICCCQTIKALSFGPSYNLGKGTVFKLLPLQVMKSQRYLDVLITLVKLLAEVKSLGMDYRKGQY